MELKERAINIAIGMIYYGLEYVHFTGEYFDRKSNVKLSETVKRDESKEPNYDVIEKKRNGVVTCTAKIIKDTDYESKREMVKIYSDFLGIDLENSGEALDYFTEFFRRFSLKQLRTNKFESIILEDSDCAFFRKYKETWLKWLDDFSNRMLLDPQLMLADLKEFCSHTHLVSTYNIERNIDKIKKFLPEVFNG